MQTTDSYFYSQMKEKRLRFDVQHVLLRLKVVVTERRKRIVYCSAEEDDVAAPRAPEEIFVDKCLRQVTVKASLLLLEAAIPTALMTKALLNRFVMAPTCDNESCRNCLQH